MDEEILIQTLGKLRDEINLHNYRYHVLDSPIISDDEYDKLLVNLRKIEEDRPDLITADSPSQRAGAPPSDKFDKVNHPSPILSLANAFDPDDVLAWLQRIGKIDPRAFEAKFSLEPKLDGLSVVLHYQNGYFTLGATRGNGEIGENITTNMRTVKAMPLKIPTSKNDLVAPDELVVRGEVFIRLSDFKKMNKELAARDERTYVNPRNTAAGTLRQLDSSLTATRPLTLLIYQVVHSTETLPATQQETIKYLNALGFPTPESQFMESMDSLQEIYQYWQAKRLELDYEIDGLVIKIDDHSLFDDLGVVGKDPRGAVALKFPAKEVTTILNDIGVNVGRTGVLTPYAKLEPVEVGGVIVRQATLHNFDFIADKDIRIGDRVLLKRAGDVIPYIIGPIIDARTGSEKSFLPPDNCPVCDQKVEHKEGEVAWYCINSACPAQVIRNIEHFVSRGTMDIVGLGIKIVEQLMSEKIIEDFADLYRLRVDDLTELEGFGLKKAENIISAIDASRSQPMARLLAALGIKGVGESIALDLAVIYDDLDGLANASTAELENIEGIGPNIAESIRTWFDMDGNKNLLEKLKRYDVWPVKKDEPTNSESSSSLAGLTFVITGKLPTLSRSQAKEYIQANGGRVMSSISTKTDYLLAGEKSGSKLDKANKLEVKVINEESLFEIVKQS